MLESKAWLFGDDINTDLIVQTLRTGSHQRSRGCGWR